MNNSKKLIEMREQLDDAKEAKARFEGEERAAQKTLESDFQCKDIKEGKSKLKKIDKEIDDLEKEIDEDMKKLEKDFNWEGSDETDF